MSHSTPLIIGHRGSSAHLPENTLESFKLAFMDHKADMIEFDVRQSKDGVPVIFHDPSLERTTNGTGLVRNMKLSELERLDAGYYFDPGSAGKFVHRNQNMTIPTFESILTNFPGKKLAVEIKDISKPLLHRVMDLIEHYSAEDLCTVGSLNDRVNRMLRSSYPGRPRLSSRREVISLITEFFFKKHSEAPAPGLIASIPIRMLGCDLDNAEWVAFLHRKNIPVYYWTINDSETMIKLKNIGADGIMTNDPLLARHTLFG